MILDAISAAYIEGNTAKVISLMPQLMDARGKTVLETPCAVGETVYQIVNLCSGESKIAKGQITCYEVISDHMQFYFYDPNLWHSIWCDLSEFGKTVFLTEAEAHKALEARKT